MPTWQQVGERSYEPWDEIRDGPRLRLPNDGDAAASLGVVLDHLASLTRAS